MKKFLLRYWIILIAAFFSLVIVLFYIPFVFPPNPPCVSHYSGQFGGLCTFTPPISLIDYIINPVPIGTIVWQIPVIAFVVFSAFFYGEIKIIKLVAKSQNKKWKPWALFLKIATIAAIIFIPFFIVSHILSFFGIA